MPIGVGMLVGVGLRRPSPLYDFKVDHALGSIPRDPHRSRDRVSGLGLRLTFAIILVAPMHF